MDSYSQRGCKTGCKWTGVTLNINKCLFIHELGKMNDISNIYP
jgi:hypothetical protein